MFVVGVIGAIFTVSFFVLAYALITSEFEPEPAGPIDSEDIDSVIALCNAEYAYTL